MNEVQSHVHFDRNLLNRIGHQRDGAIPLLASVHFANELVADLPAVFVQPGHFSSQLLVTLLCHLDQVHALARVSTERIHPLIRTQLRLRLTNTHVLNQRIRQGLHSVDTVTNISRHSLLFSVLSAFRLN